MSDIMLQLPELSEEHQAQTKKAVVSTEAKNA